VLSTEQCLTPFDIDITVLVLLLLPPVGSETLGPSAGHNSSVIGSFSNKGCKSMDGAQLSMSGGRVRNMRNNGAAPSGLVESKSDNLHGIAAKLQPKKKPPNILWPGSIITDIIEAAQHSLGWFNTYGYR
jgi:hypothetical protein